VYVQFSHDVIAVFLNSPKGAYKMDVITRDNIEQLVKKQEFPAVSIYMPAHRAGPEVRQNPIRFKNLLQKAQEMLDEMGVPGNDILQPTRDMEKDDFFWSKQSEGLALFLSPHVFLSFRLPLRFDELVVVTERFHTKPLLPLLSSQRMFYILTLSQDGVRLLQCTGQHFKEVTPKEVPRGIAEALKYDDPQSQLQFHTGAKSPGPKRPAMFHGHGVGIDETKDNIRRYFYQVDKGLHSVLHDENAPLVLVGGDHLLPLYGEANSYPHLLDKGVDVNPEALSDEELHEQAWSVVEPFFMKARQETADQYRDLLGTGRTSNDLKEILPQASFGRVESLFVSVGVQRWGIFDEKTGEVALHERQEPGDCDLLDLAALYTLIKGGTVHAVTQDEVPDESPICATFRY
jgi:hypothetical protein